MICPSFTLKAVALAPYCAITTIQTTLLRSLNVLLPRVKIRKRGADVPFNYVSPVVQLCPSTFTCRASCTCAVFKIIWELENLLRNLGSLSVRSKKQLWLFSLVSSHYACGISGWTTQLSVLSFTSCRHSDLRCGLVTQWLQTNPAVSQFCGERELSGDFSRFIVLISCGLTQGRMRIVLRSSKLWILFSCFNTSSFSADRQTGAKGLK